MTREPTGSPPSAPNHKQRRQRAILDIVGRQPIGSQEELAERLRERGFEATQATVSRDVAELGLVKVQRGERHIYVAPENVVAGDAYDARLCRLLEDIPVRIGRSGLTLVLTATPGSAGAIAQAIDQSSLTDQVGTLAGDNTLLVLFENEPALLRWIERFEQLQPAESEAWRPASRRPGSGSSHARHATGNGGVNVERVTGVVPVGLAEAPIVPVDLAEAPAPVADPEPVSQTAREGSDPRPLAHSEARR